MGPADRAHAASRAARLTWLLAIAVCAAGCWPFYADLALPPMAADAPVLLARVDPARGEALEWILSQPHFGVTWRPATMASVALDLLLGGGRIGWLRVVDLLLHAGACLTVFAVARRVVPGRAGASWCALLVALGHPLVLEVVPFLPRRSYSLCVVLAGCGTLALLGARARVFLPALAAAALFALALMAHEVAGFWIVGALGLHLAAAEDPRATLGARSRRAAALFGPTALAATLVLVRRAQVLDGGGGYAAGDARLSVAEVLTRLAEGLLPGPGGLPPWVGAAALTGALLLYAGRGGRGRALALLAWLACGAGVLALQGVWFERMAQPLLAPLALALGLLVGAGSRTPRVLGLFLVALALAHSPLVHGVDPKWRAARRARAGLIEELEVAARSALAEASEGEAVTLRLVLPFREGGEEAPEASSPAEAGEHAPQGEVLQRDAPAAQAEGRGRAARRLLSRDALQPVRWVQHLLDPAPITLSPWVWIEEPTAPYGPPPEVTPDGALELPVDRSILVVRPGTTNPRRRPSNAGARLAIPRVRQEEGRVWLYAYGWDAPVPVPLPMR